MQILRVARDIDSRVVHFLLMRLSGSVFAWVGDEALSFEELHVALPPRDSSSADGCPTTCVMGSLDGVSGEVAQKLSIRFGEPIFLSVNVPNADEEGRLLLGVQKHLIELLAVREDWPGEPRAAEPSEDCVRSAVL
uniref:Proteasome assembly chaperone 3 n=1 Tax=Chromera velia CCMP2878 TaxID=1169474 RepID=A0A0G4HNT3_9ALVE|eukprot:Cvel_29658.t1-p1 / transcript=Cvel_29658.t1 / gene=Cvel_29658 / organism=Chromera_velia_CCMP2878 / gene_product=hypothetical protein / transcript_product=hypothetical protein / location=Cvel_scaffold4097:2794-6837(+) / protein_length=135 / sequence_SO=supercontig / SO=protein_coding / is_pseudo=false